MGEPAIIVSDLHKEFILPQHKHSSFKQAFVHFGRKNVKKHQRALNDISFHVKKGEFFGIVGKNGSGKSTLLKILAGVYSPTRGNVEVNGNLTPFIELGVGFNPELSGRDNVFLNGALLGFSRKEMNLMYNDIVEFAELEPFMDQKLKNYSSGMQVRLAFSIAIKAKNDLLIFDEVLAVGDEAFQRKCLDIFEQYKANKQTVVLVTHDMETVRKFCTRAMLINDGVIVKIGNPREVADKYSELNQSETDRSVERENDKEHVEHYLKVDILDSNLRPRAGFKLSDRLIVDIDWQQLGEIEIESIGVNIFKQSGEHLTGINSRTANLDKGWKNNKHIRISFDLNITPGKYSLLVVAFKEEGVPIDSVSEGLKFTVASTKMPWSGLIELPHQWIDVRKSNQGREKS